MAKKLQVFVSSTYKDLIEERQVAVSAILNAGHIPAGMELFRAGQSQMDTIKKWIDESDVYCLILGGSYGSVEVKTGKSYTQLEYEYAISKGMPLFAIVLSDSMLHHKAVEEHHANIIETGMYAQDYINFKDSVLEKIVLFVNNLADIEANIVLQLKQIEQTESSNLIGWTCGAEVIYELPSELSPEQKMLLAKANSNINNKPIAESYIERANLLVSFDSTYYKCAIPDYLYAIYLEPKYPKAYYKLIECLTVGGDYERALQYAEEACRLFPNDGEAYESRADVLRAKGMHPEAIEDCSRAIELTSKCEFYNTRGLCYLGQTQHRSALDDFATALRLDTEYQPAIENAIKVVRMIKVEKVVRMAIEERNLGHFEKAKGYFDCALLAEPANEFGLQEYGAMYFELEKHADALEWWEKALNQNPSSKNYYLCAIANEGLKKTERTIELCKKALECKDDKYRSLIINTLQRNGAINI